MRSLVLLLLIGVLAPTSTQAMMYEWTDDQGVVNFTDNPERVPARYLDRVRKLPSIDEKAAPSPAKGGESAAPAAAPKMDAADKGKKELYGGHDEGWWRDRYTAPRRELNQLRNRLPAMGDELAALRRRMNLYHFTRDRTAYYDKQAEIGRAEARIKELEGELSALEAEATRAGVPFDWRR